MGSVSPTQISDGTSIDASDVNTPVNELANVINGNIETVNLADSAVSTAKIADDAVTGAKIASYNIIHQDVGSAIANVNDLVIKTGFAYVAGAASTALTGSVTFATAFPNELIAVVATGVGRKTTAGAPADIGDLTNSATSITCQINGTSYATTGFGYSLENIAGSNLSDNFYGVNWIAIGR